MSLTDSTAFEDRLTAAFRAGLDLPADADATALTFGGHPHWDSLGHMSLVTTIEEAFAVELSEDDVMAIDSYASAAAVLKAVVPVVP